MSKILNKNSYKYYRGHFGYHSKFIKNKFVFTMLRNPINRTISHYKHMLREPNDKGWFNHFFNYKDESLKSILTDPSRAYLITNVQTKYLSSGYDPLIVKNPKYFSFDGSDEFNQDILKQPKKSLVKSIINLLKINFFGIQEYNEESIIMLADKLKIKSPLLKERRMFYNNESCFNQVDTETQNLLYHMNNLDNKLYFIARHIFEHRMLNFINKKLNKNMMIHEYLFGRTKYLSELEQLVLK